MLSADNWMPAVEFSGAEKLTLNGKTVVPFCASPPVIFKDTCPVASKKLPIVSGELVENVLVRIKLSKLKPSVRRLKLVRLAVGRLGNCGELIVALEMAATV